MGVVEQAEFAREHPRLQAQIQSVAVKTDLHVIYLGQIHPNRMHYTRTTLTLDNIHSLHEDERLNLNPLWQRDAVWPDARKPALIVSLINGVPIPEITLWLRQDGVYVAVDGKQRLSAILDYMNGDFKANDDFYLDLTREESETLDNTSVTVLLLGPENSEASVIAYYKLRNSTSSSLTTGELIKADSDTPIVVQTLQTFADRRMFIEEVFGSAKSVKRSGALTNTIPYLASLMHGIGCLTKSYPAIKTILASVTQEQVDAVRNDYNAKMTTFLQLCRSIINTPANARLKEQWKGFPPLGKVSVLWMTILNPELLKGRDLTEFWLRFYEVVHADPAHAMSWDTYTRKNATLKQLTKNLEWAHQISSVRR